MKINGADKKYLEHFMLVISYICIYMLLVNIIFKVDFIEKLLAFIMSVSVIIIPECRYYKSLHYRYQSCKEDEQIKNRLKHNNFHKLENYPIYYEGESDKYANELKGLFDELPDNQKNHFTSKGFIIIIGKHNTLLKMHLLSKNSQGVFYCADKAISISQNTTEKHPEFANGIPRYMIKSVFYHEWCHFLDYYHGYISEEETVKKLYKEDKNNYPVFKRIPFGNSLRDRIKDIILYSKTKRPYEYKNTEEYLAVNYSNYKMDIIYNTQLIEIFDILESTT